jgi:tetratricopeptide (TPR) repeat protein
VSWLPLYWARTQSNRGNALRAIGERESETEPRAEAVAAYRAALEVRTRNRVPLYWARTQNVFGLALKTLGERESGTARLEEAVTAYNSAPVGFGAAGAQSEIDTCRANRDKAQALLAQRKS